MRKRYECSTCGVVTEVDTQVCHPRPVSGKEDYCGTAPEPGGLCDTMKHQLPFVCGNCGRPAEQAELVCDPVVLGEPVDSE